MITPELRAEIRHLYYAEHWRVGTIAAALGVHQDTVSAAIASETFHRPRPAERRRRTDPFIGFIRETLRCHPRLRATRLFAMLRDRGYDGSVTQLRRIVRELRPRTPEPYLKLESFPGDEAQVDWASFGTVAIGKARRRLSAFVLVLSWSRAMWVEFFLDQVLESFLAGHVHAFHDLGGASRRIRLDNLRSAVLERLGSAIRFHPRYLDLCAHYHAVPRPCDVGRGNQKGRVERTIRYLRESFFAGRSFSALEDLNRQARAWRDEVAHQRPWPADRSRTVADALAEERERLLALPIHPFDTEQTVDVRTRKTIYVRFDTNDYSIPPEALGRRLVVAATPDTVRILDGMNEIARHRRSWDKGDTITDLQHRAAVLALKDRATGFASIPAILRSVPGVTGYLEACVQARRPLAREMRLLEQFLSDYGATALAAAIAIAAEKGAPHADAVLFLLEQAVRAERRRPLLPVDLSHHPELVNLDVKPHSLETYDALAKNDIQQDD